jgi:hypothetical protein
MAWVLDVLAAHRVQLTPTEFGALCALADGDTDRADLSGVKVRRSDRNREIVELAGQGLTSPQLAARFGITHQRVSQILAAEGIAIGELARQRRADVRAAAEADRIRGRTRPCKVCGRPFLTVANRGTCSPECAAVLRIGRRYLDPAYYDIHRVQQARYAVAHPERVTPANLALARRIVNGDIPAPNRRYFIPGSKVVAAFEAAGVAHLLPAPSPRSRSRRQQGPSCAAVNRNGTPCRRGATPGDPLCHIHRAAAAGVSIAELARPPTEEHPCPTSTTSP